MKNNYLPKSAVLELTYRCNHKCKFCSCPWDAPNSDYPKGEELSISDWKKAVDILYDEGIEGFSISGGEALLKEGFEEILQHIRKEGERRGLHRPIVLISNARKMTEEYLHIFKELDIHLSMSLPGYETFQEHTGVDNADGVLHWFQVAKSIGLNTTVNVTVTKKNYHELFRTLSLGLIYGAGSILLNRFLPGGRGLSFLNELRLTPAQVNGMLDTAEEVLSYANRQGNVGTEIPYCAIKDPSKYKHIHFGFQCAAAKGFFVIDPSGKIRTCNHSPHIVGHIFGKPMIEDVDYWNLFAHSEYKPTICSSCTMAQKCDCGCREVANILYGNPREKDPSIIE